MCWSYTQPVEFRATWASKGRVLIPDSGRIADGLWMHSACHPLLVAGSNLSGQLAKVSVRLVPSTAYRGASLPHPHLWEAVLSHLGAQGSIDAVIIMKPADARRSRLLVMGLGPDRRAVGFAKLTRNPPNPLATRILETLALKRRSFLFPRIRETLNLGDWWLTIEEPVPQEPHWPAALSAGRRHDTLAEIQELLQNETDTTKLAHGDFGPWNVREMARSGLAILDWEDACWAPEAVDELWHAVTSRLARGKQPRTVVPEVKAELGAFFSDAVMESAAKFWLERWHKGEPPEIRAGVQKSGKLLRSEMALKATLRALIYSDVDVVIRN